MNNKLVSIMIPTYNAAKTITDTLSSILSQTCKNMEVVVIDNASTDNTVEIVKRFDDPRLKVIINPINIGAEGNFNKCIELSNGDYIAIYHADDIYDPHIVEEEIQFLDENKQCGVVFTTANIINEENNIIGKIDTPQKLKTNKSIYQLSEILPALLEHGNSFLICPSAMVRKDIYTDKTMRWRGDIFGNAADLDLWLRILENHSIGIIHQPLIKYRHSTTHFSYNYHRTRTEEDTSIPVFNFYIIKHSAILTQNDRINYSFYKKKDNIKRAVNYILLNNIDEAKKMLKGLDHKDIINKGFSNFHNFRIYLAGLVLSCALKIGLGYQIANIIKQYL